ncbi:hypothetical protein [Agarilytica rhodophyticola]|uniref:hypothetical protein n=1 Tax=Agarilytica rhodophyticola TaxID=1737490 RepID=UPI001319E108|nr:hypothetical protein [Agarilytica rhodophyticola]
MTFTPPTGFSDSGNEIAPRVREQEKPTKMQAAHAMVTCRLPTIHSTIAFKSMYIARALPT